MYFKNIEKDNFVYSLIYGEGKVKNVLPKGARVEGFYIFSVQFDKNLIHYTEDGVPNWCGNDCGTQTIFYKQDIDFERVDFKPIEEELSIKKIKKLRDSGKLEMLCPSGLWRNIEACPLEIVQNAIKKAKTSLFRISEFVGNDRRKR